MSEDRSHDKAATLSRWALGIAQALILSGLGWFGRQQLDMHDQLNQLSWEMQAARSNTQQVGTNKMAIDRLEFRVSDLERRQLRDESLRDKLHESRP